MKKSFILSKEVKDFSSEKISNLCSVFGSGPNGTGTTYIPTRIATNPKGGNKF